MVVVMIDIHLNDLRDCFLKNGFEIKFVGGCVRDSLLGITPKDIDLATNASPTQQFAIYQQYGIKCIDTGLKHGTWTVILDKPYEITSLRKDISTNGRHADVEYISDWIIDSSRRDFTINAMYKDFENKIFDYHDGQYDLLNGFVRFVGNADQRIKEDYLRILRYYRFCNRFGNGVNDHDIIANLNGLKKISAERIWSELKQIFKLNNAEKTLNQMKEHGVFGVLEIDVDISFYNTNARPETNLALMCTDFSKVAKMLKLSTCETNMGAFVKNNQHLSEKQAKIYLTNNVKMDFVKEALTICGVSSEQIENWSIPKFPITGDMLKDQFEGVALGKEIKRLKQIWYDNDFNLSGDIADVRNCK